MGQPEVSVVVPTLNERENLEPLVTGIARHVGRSFEVIVVDDASPDGTAAVADALASRWPVRVLRRPGRLGLGSAYRDGFALARGAIIVQMDADLSHDPQALPSLCAAAERGPGLAIGSRYVPGGAVEGWGPLRRATSRVANALARAALDLPVRDATSGYRAWASEHAGIVAGTTTDGYAFQVETLHLVAAAGVPTLEVPIRFRDRRAGRSKLGPSEVARFTRTVIGLRRAQAP